MADNSRGIHVSPGVYSREIELSYAVKSLGITTLGIVGETQRGPAFQPMHIENWREFVEKFGGTSTEKFKGSQYPKYELPYVAKSYLTESKQLEVVRVLGLSGYKAGPAWVITAYRPNADGNEVKKNMAVAVLRSRAHYEQYHRFDTDYDTCDCPADAYDRLVFDVGEIKRKDGTCKVYNFNDAVKLSPYVPLYASGNDCDGYDIKNDGKGNFTVSSTNYGRFLIEGLTGYQDEFTSKDKDSQIVDSNNGYFRYAVTLNPSDKEYILKVLGTDPQDGDAPLYVESLYDVALVHGITDGITEPTHIESINSGLTFYQAYDPSDYDGLEPINGFVRTQETGLQRRNLGMRFIADEHTVISGETKNDPMLTAHPYDYESGLPIRLSDIYNISAHTTNSSAIAIKKDPTNPQSVLNYDNYNDSFGEYVSSTTDSITGIVVSTKITEEKTEKTTGLSIEAYDRGEYKVGTYNEDFGGFIASVSAYTRTQEGQTTRQVSGTSYTSFTVNYVDYYKLDKKSVLDKKFEAITGETLYFDENSVRFKVSGDSITYSGETQLEALYPVFGTGGSNDYDVLLINLMAEYSSGKTYVGQIYTVVQYTDKQGKRHYFYRYYPEENVKAWAEKQKTMSSKYVDIVPIVDKLKPSNSAVYKPYDYKTDHNTTLDLSASASTRFALVKNLSDGLYYKLEDEHPATGTNAYSKSGDEPASSMKEVKWYVDYVNCDLNNYASAYRYASTPWIVSNLKGDYNKIELNRLMRFHTISDGSMSNYEIKVSIENILPDEGLFDVVVRDINDVDESTVPLERFSKCNLTPGDARFVAFKIGSFDGIYESKSKYITVEVAEGTPVAHSVPAGFLGYPLPKYDGRQVLDETAVNPDIVGINIPASAVTVPLIRYNLSYDNDVKNRKQYFGLSSRVGVDVDLFTYKGLSAYIDNPEMLTQGFHLDARLDGSNYATGNPPEITVDGELGYKFDAVSVNNRTSILNDIPLIGKEIDMVDCIYNYVNLRKFTVYFYGGFDGWDVYRNQRSNTDDFKLSKYRGTYDKASGEGRHFNRIDDPDALGLNQNGITSDWYAYLSAYRQFANPEAVDINVFATPGIDYVNNGMLVKEVIDMIEEERADSIYVVTTPDKPSGAADYVDEMYTPEDAVYNLEDSEIDSNYTCTYYPWVKYFDQDNNQYIYLPPTKDVVRNFALTDNQTYSWFAPAGIDRGDVHCVRAHFITRLADEDVLYEGRINPIKTFAVDGVKLWGQKNLQIRESQLNRIAVRRLLLRMRKLIAIACRPIIFEPNDTVTKNTFLSAVTPIMDNIRANRGISDYKIEVNDTIESRERRELPAKIYFKPYNALEYIDLSFILTPEGISFDNI